MFYLAEPYTWPHTALEILVLSYGKCVESKVYTNKEKYQVNFTTFFESNVTIITRINITNSNVMRFQIPHLIFFVTLNFNWHCVNWKGRGQFCAHGHWYKLFTAWSF